jgi:hypothetical protein
MLSEAKAGLIQEAFLKTRGNFSYWLRILSMKPEEKVLRT